jgi:hypothetical protein
MNLLKHWTYGALISTSLLVGCASSPNQASPASGFSSALKGIGNLILSPLQIAGGLIEGIATLPYYAATGIHQLNRGLQQANAKITLEDTYQSAYGVSLNKVPDQGDTGQVFHRMRQASAYLQQVLKQYGVADAEHYVLTSIDTANNQGYGLYAVVYRPQNQITVIDKYDRKTPRTFGPEDRLYYEPFKTTIDGQPLDQVVDWAGVVLEQARSQKQQAVLLTLAANRIVAGQRRNDYWAAEANWLAGQVQTIMQNQEAKARGAIGI